MTVTWSSRRSWRRNGRPISDGQKPQAILFVHHGGFNWVRGATRCLLDLLAHLDRTKFQPIVWCNQPAVMEAVSALDVPVHRARDWEGCHPLRPAQSWVRDARSLVRRYNVRLIHVDEFTQAAMLWRVARTARIPLLSHLHQVPTADERRWSLLHQVDLAVGTSQAAIAGLLEDGFPRERAMVVYNGVDPERLSRGDASGLRAALGIGAGDTVITVVTSLVAHKGVDVALRAFHDLLQHRQGCHLLICGNGPEQSGLVLRSAELGIQSRVHFLGERSDVGVILRDATDVLLSTSREESFGLTLAEAGVFGLPIVATDIDAHREVLADGEAGMLVSTDAPEECAGALARLARDPALRAEYGWRARRRVEQAFLVHRYVADFERVYSGLLNRPPREYGWLRGSRWPSAYTRWARDAVSRRIWRRTPRADGDDTVTD